MSIVNKVVKFFGKLGVHLSSLLTCFGLSVVYSSWVICLVLSILSIFKILPLILLTKMWLVFLIACVPLTIIFFIIVEKGFIKQERTNKEFVKLMEKEIEKVAKKVEENKNTKKE